MAKKLRDEDLVLNIIVNGDRGKKEIGQLERAIKDTTSELKALEKQEKQLRAEGKKDTEQYRAVTAAIKQKNEALVLSEARLKQLKQGLDINRMSLSDLRKEMTRISRLRNIATPGTEEWKKHDAELQRVRARYNEVRGESMQTGTTIERMSSKASKAIGWVTAAVASMSAAFFGIKNATDKFAEFDDQVADVMKTTGLLKQDVIEINENLKSFDTRSSQEELLALGRVAGKLGIDTREEVEGFIRSADQIGVALSEDLGGDVEQAINDVGKLVDIFNVSEEFGIEQGLLKTGSAINELGAASTANEGYLVDFTKRLGGVAPAAGISMANVLGLGATLDQYGQSVEVSGTAMSQLITNMFDDTAAYARVANIEVGEFSDLLKKDANEALIALLEGVKGNDEGMQKLVGRLKDLGIDGARATAVVGVLANNTETLRTQQALANDAFEKGTSLTEEFAIKNNTAAAELDKARKQVHNLWVELGERLFPVVTAGNNLFSIFLASIITIFDFIRENWKLITVLAGAIAGYNAAMFISNLRMKEFVLLSQLKTFWLNTQRASLLLAAAAQALWHKNTLRSAAAMRLFNTIVKANPFVLIASLATAAAVAIYHFSKELTSAEKAQKKLLDVQIEAEKSIASQKIEMERLLEVARDKTKSDEERQKAVKALNDLSPEYLGNLTLEKINTEEATKATDKYIDSLLRQASVKAAEEELVELQKQRIEAMRTGQAEELSFWQKTKLAVAQAANSYEYMNDVREQYRQENRKKVEEDFAAQENLLKNFIKSNLEIESSAPEASASPSTPTTPFAGETEEQRKAREKAEKEAERKRKSAAEKAAKDREKELSDQKEFREKILAEQETLADQERIAYMKRLQEAGIFGKEMKDMTTDEIQVLEALQKQHHANLNKIDADAFQDAINRKQSEFEKERNLLRIQHNEEFKEITTLEQAKKALEGELSQEALREIRTLREARKELDKMYMRQEEELTREHLGQLQSILRNAIETGDWQGIDLSDKILSEEEKKILEERLQEVALKLSELGLGTDTGEAEDRGLRRSSVDVLGMSAENWETFFENLKEGEASIEELQGAANALIGIWSQYNAFVDAGEKRKLQEFESATNQKEAALKKQLENGVITQEQYNARIDKLNAELDHKKAVYERNAAKRERNVALMSAIVNTAAAVAKALPNIFLSTLVGAMGALQIGTILRTPLPEIPGREDGGFLVTRAQDKKLFRAKADPDKRGYVDRPTVIAGEDGTEFVASNEAYRNPTIKPVLDAIDVAQRNGTISSINLSKVLSARSQMMVPGRQTGGFVSDRPAIPAKVQAVPVDPAIAEALEQNNRIMAELRDQLRAGITADVSLLGRRGFYEAERNYQDIQNNVNL